MSVGNIRPTPRFLGMFAASLMLATAITTAVTVLPSTPVNAQQQLHAAAIDPTKGFADLVDRVMPAVVSVKVKFANVAAIDDQSDGQQALPPGIPEDSPFRDFFKQFPQFRQGQPDQAPQRGGMAQGSGFIISADGYAVTNNHVVKDAEESAHYYYQGTQTGGPVQHPK